MTNANPTITFLRPSQQNFIEHLGRVDQTLSSKDHLALRYFYDSFHAGGVLDLTNLLNYSDQADIRYHNALISENHIFTDHLLNTVLFSYQIENAGRGPIAGSPSVVDLGVKSFNPDFK